MLGGLRFVAVDNTRYLGFRRKKWMDGWMDGWKEGGREDRMDSGDNERERERGRERERERVLTDAADCTYKSIDIRV